MLSIVVVHRSCVHTCCTWSAHACCWSTHVHSILLCAQPPSAAQGGFNLAEPNLPSQGDAGNQQGEHEMQVCVCVCVCVCCAVCCLCAYGSSLLSLHFCQGCAISTTNPDRLPYVSTCVQSAFLPCEEHMCRSNVQEPMYVFQLASPMLCCCSVQEQEKEEEDSHTGHAVLHGFCMTIPYGAL